MKQFLLSLLILVGLSLKAATTVTNVVTIDQLPPANASLSRADLLMYYDADNIGDKTRKLQVGQLWDSFGAMDIIDQMIRITAGSNTVVTSNGLGWPTTYTISSTATGGGGGTNTIGGVTNTAVTYVDSVLGNNSTAITNSATAPYLTPSFGVTNTIPGGLVRLYGGPYNDQISFFKGKTTLESYSLHSNSITPLYFAATNGVATVVGAGTYIGGFYGAFMNKPGIWNIEGEMFRGSVFDLNNNSTNSFWSVHSRQGFGNPIELTGGGTNVITADGPTTSDITLNGSSKLVFNGMIRGNGTIRASGANTFVRLNGDIDTTGLAYFIDSGATGILYGNSFADSDGFDARTNAIGIIYGNLKSRSDTGLFFDTGAYVIGYGDTVNETFDGNYNLQGNGGGITPGASLNGTNGGRVTWFGNVKGAMPIVNMDGEVYVRGSVSNSFNGHAPVYRYFTGEVIYATAQFLPPDRTNWIGNAISTIGSGRTTVDGGPVWGGQYPGAHLRAWTNAEPRLILKDCIIGSDVENAVLLDGGHIETYGHVTFVKGSGVPNAVYTTNVSPRYIFVHGTVSGLEGSLLGTNVFIVGTNYSPQISSDIISARGSSATLQQADRSNTSDLMQQVFNGGIWRLSLTNDAVKADLRDNAGVLTLTGAAAAYEASKRGAFSDYWQAYWQGDNWNLFNKTTLKSVLGVNMTNGWLYWGPNSNTVFFTGVNPESNITGKPGDLNINTNGGAGATIYVKETGVNTTTGWAALGSSTGGVNTNQMATNIANVSLYDYGPVFGAEYLVRAHERIITNTPGNVLRLRFSGDSTTLGVGIVNPSNTIDQVVRDVMLNWLPDAFVQNAGISGKDTKYWLTNALATDIAACATNDVIVLRWGLNDGMSNRVDFLSDLNTGLQTLRASYPVTNLTIVLMAWNAANATNSGRDQIWQDINDFALRQIARSNQCTYIDTFRIWRDAARAYTWMDDPFGNGERIHPLDVANRWIGGTIAEAIVPVGIRSYGSSRVMNLSYTGFLPADTLPPSGYPMGISMARVTGGAWPADGMASTLRHTDGVAQQFISGYSTGAGTGTTNLYFRLGAVTNWFGGFQRILTSGTP